jgi:hydroxypyruvate reductase 1
MTAKTSQNEKEGNPMRGLLKTVNPSGEKRVLVTRDMPGSRWLEILTDAGCAVEVNELPRALTAAEICAAIGGHGDGVIGQITEARISLR